MPVRTLSIMLLAIIISVRLIAQQVTGAASDAPRFEAVSISELRAPTGGALPRAPDLFTANGVSLKLLVSQAYETPAFRIVGGPDWASSTLYVVAGKAPFAPSRVQMQQMLRQMLQERFALRTHRETRDMPNYELVTARADKRLGPNMTVAESDCQPFVTGARPMSDSATIKREDGSFPRCARVITLTTHGFHPWLNGAPIAELAQRIEGTVQRTVADKTGLSGVFDIDLTYVLPEMPGGPASADRFDGVQLATALQEQLGLRLEATHGPVEVIVIDAASPPTPN